MFCLSRTGAVLRKAALAGLAAAASLCLLAACSRPAQAQIASYVDAQGRVTYVNANPPAKAMRRQMARQPFAPPVKLLQIAEAVAKRNDMDPALVQAVIQTESNWNPFAVSSKGAFGLMQLLPSTAERYGVRDVFDPEQNVKGGTRYLRDLLDLYHGDLKKSLAAYNAGEQAVAKFGGVPAYRETRNYVRKVTNTYFQSGAGPAYAGQFRRHSEIRQVKDSGGRTVFTNE
jgi:soluble lytic murein transglycosylase-like protein